jgi:peptide chain release factor 1
LLPLLERARSITKEHSELSKKLDNGYDAKIAKKAGELSAVVTALQSWEKANEVNDNCPLV